MIQIQIRTHIQTLRINNGRGYFNIILGDCLLKKEIIH